MFKIPNGNITKSQRHKYKISGFLNLIYNLQMFGCDAVFN